MEERLAKTWGEILEELTQKALPWDFMTREQRTELVRKAKRSVGKTTRDRVNVTWDRIGQAFHSSGDALETHYRRWEAQNRSAAPRSGRPQDRAKEWADSKAEKAAALGQKEARAATEELFAPVQAAIRKLEAPAIPSLLNQAHRLFEGVTEPIEDWLFDEISGAVAEINKDFQILAKLQEKAEEGASR